MEGDGPTDYQLELLAALVLSRRVAVRGPHGLGKTTLAAWLILWFALTRDKTTDWKCLTTASAWRQLTKYLWPEVHKWARRLKWEAIGRPPFDERRELLTLSLKLATGEAFAVASDDPSLIEGAHADSLLYIFDEAKSIVAGTFDAAEGAFSGGGAGRVEALALAISTPGEPAGRFYDIHARRPGFEDWRVRHIRLAEATQAGRISEQWAEQRRKQWGAASAVFQNRVLGEFASQDEDGVIPLAWIEAANDRWRDWQEQGFPGEPDRAGCDVARTGTDKTTLALASGLKIGDLREYARQDTMQTVGVVMGVLLRFPGLTVIVDVIGIGAGVYDRLREQGVMVLAFNASARTDFLDRSGEFGFTNVRSAAWWMLRELLEPAYGAEVALPPDDDLTGELVAPRWRVMSGGKIQVESKDEIRKRIGRSTDHADAVIQALTGKVLCYGNIGISGLGIRGMTG